MGQVLKELIQYNGVEQCDYKHLINFKQFDIDDTICVPIQKPDIEQITKIWVDYKILDHETLKTAKGTSCEGQILTGSKVFISAELRLKIEYVASKCSQSVHSMHQTIPVSAYVTLEDTFNECSPVHPSFVIEDIHCEELDCRRFYTNIVLMAVVDVC